VTCLHNQGWANWIEAQPLPVAVVMVWTKDDADQLRSRNNLPPLTPAQWDRAVGYLEECDVTEMDDQNFQMCVNDAAKVDQL
tara:strand:+ start:81 stop:326 length:246 start_codon:yes stop_codon:yes gene_type:complete